MNVYDEYMKNQGGEDGPKANGENLNPSVEEAKDVEA